ncbi:MAG: ABC transporter permease [Candidatus Asgardarchaeia archaeon]
MLSIVLKNIYRQPRHTLTIIIGIILAVSLLTGINLTINSMTTIYFHQELQKEPVDFVVTGDMYNITELPNITQLKEDIYSVDENIKAVEIGWDLSISGELRTEPFLSKNVSELVNSDYEPETIDVWGIPNDFGSNVPNLTWIEGGISDSPFSIAIEKSMADQLNLSVGDTIYIVNIRYDPKIGNDTVNNLKLNISGIFELKDTLRKALEETRSGFVIYYSSAVFSSITSERKAPTILLTTFKNAYEIYKNASSYLYYMKGGVGQSPLIASYEGNFKAFIFLDREKVIDPWNLDVTKTRVNAIETKLDLKIKGKYTNLHVVNKIDNVFYSVEFWSEGMRINFGIFSAPTLLLGGFLAITSIYLIIEQRRRSIGLYKVKGMTNSQIKRMILLEGLILGVVAGVIGYLLGYLFNYYFTMNFINIWNIKNYAEINLFSFSTFDFALAVILAVILGIFAAWYPANAAAKLPVIEAIEEYSEEISIEKWRPKWVILWLILGTYKIVAWLVGFNSINLLFEIGPNMSNFIVIIVLGIFIFIDNFILQYIGPLLFIYSLTKIVTMKLDKISRWLEKLISPLSHGLGGMVVRNITRKPLRYTRVAFIIALTLGFGIASSIVQASNYHSQIKNVKASVGADINVQVFLGNLTYYQNITRISGVNGISPIYHFGESIGDYYTSIYAIDPKNLSVVSSDYIYSDYTKNAPFLENLDKMNKNTKYILVSESLLRNLQVDIGDNLTLTFQVNESYSVSVDFIILDIVRVIPGITYFGLFESLIVMNYHCFESQGISIENMRAFRLDTILVDVSQNVNATKVAQEIVDMYPNTYVRVAQDELNSIMNNPTYSASLLFLDVEYVITLFIATVGIGLLMAMAVVERRKEFGILIARGTSPSQIIQLLLAESFVLMLVSVSIGVISGVASGFGWANYASTLSFITVFTEVVVPNEVYYLIFGGIIAFIIATLIPAYIASKTNIREALHLG